MSVDADNPKKHSASVARIPVNRSNTVRYLAMFFAGLLLGWFVLGWWLAPVEYTEVYPNELRTDVLDAYLLMAAESYATTGDIQDAAMRLRYWNQEDLGPLLHNRANALQSAKPASAQYMRNLATDLRLTETGQLSGAQTVQSVGQADERLTTLGRLLLYVIVAVLAVAALIIVWRRLNPIKRARRTRLQPRSEAEDKGPEGDQRATEADDAVYDLGTSDEGPEPIVLGSPLSTVEASAPPVDDYSVSPPKFARIDQSHEEEPPPWQSTETPEASAFGETNTTTDSDESSAPPSDPYSPLQAPVHRATGEPPDTEQAFLRFDFDGTADYNVVESIEERETYLGEYGMAADKMPQDNTEQVLSLEVWLFDKSDIHTVSAVLVPIEAFDDDELMSKLTGGDNKKIVPLEPNAQIHLKTERLEIHGRVRRVDFGPLSGDLPIIQYAEIELIGRIRQ